MASPIPLAPADPRPPRRRTIRLSVRELMLVVLVLGVGLGWVVNRARVQREAVAAIERTGGRVVYDRQRTPGIGPVFRFNLKAEPPGPKWLVDRLGVDYFGHVISASLGERATDAEMEHLGRLPRLERVHAGGAGITDAGVAQLRGLTLLTFVTLDHTRTTGAALAEVGRLPDLIRLDLVGMKFGDADLAPLAGLGKLKHLNLSSNPITDAGMFRLAGLTRLEYLDLGQTEVTGDGLASLRGMKALAKLFLAGTKVADLRSLPPLDRLDSLAVVGTPLDDSGLAGLTALRGLKTLSLSKTRITDAGLASIAGLPSLEHLGLDGTGVTDAGLIPLAGSKALERILVNGTAVTIAGLESLARSKSLRAIHVNETAITPAGAATFGAAHPGIKVVILDGRPLGPSPSRPAAR